MEARRAANPVLAVQLIIVGCNSHEDEAQGSRAKPEAYACCGETWACRDEDGAGARLCLRVLIRRSRSVLPATQRGEPSGLRRASAALRCLLKLQGGLKVLSSLVGQRRREDAGGFLRPALERGGVFDKDARRLGELVPSTGHLSARAPCWRCLHKQQTSQLPPNLASFPDVDMPYFKEACQHPGVSACDVTLQPRCGALLGEGCPGHHWFEAIASIRGNCTSPVLVNVGANKGYVRDRAVPVDVLAAARRRLGCTR